MRPADGSSTIAAFIRVFLRSKQKPVGMKTLGLALLVLVLVGAQQAAGQSQDAPLGQLLKDFGRPATTSRVSVLIVHLNDRTADALFEAPLKYSLRAQARAATMFYVQGTAASAGELNTDFRIQQGEESYQARIVNMSNFTRGTKLSAGDKVRGIIVIDKRLDLRLPIDVYYGSLRVTFDFPPNVVAQIVGK